jgi:hypothetical protein
MKTVGSALRRMNGGKNESKFAETRSFMMADFGQEQTFRLAAN